MYENRTLVRGDNLEEMRKFPDECIDLIATDPPFNSKRNYFVPYRDIHGQEPDTLVKAFTDTWTWGESAEEAYNHLLVDIGSQVGDTIEGLRPSLNVFHRHIPNTQPRDFILGVSTGGRISELLSLTIGDVWQNDRAVH